MLTMKDVAKAVENQPTNFDKAKLEEILERLYKNYELDKGYDFDLLELLAADKPEPVEKKKDGKLTLFENFIQNTIAFDVAMLDPDHAIYLGNFDCTPEEVMDRLYTNEDKKSVEYYKTSLLQGVYVDKDGKRVLPKEVFEHFQESIENGVKREFPGINLSSDNSRYKRIISDLLFPNIEEFKNTEENIHEITLNVNGLNYADILENIYASCVDAKIPFYFVVRDESEMDKGMTDSIRIYTSSKYVDTMLKFIDEMVTLRPDAFLKPSYTTLNVNDVIGYTKVNPNSKSTLDMIADVITKAIDQEINDYSMIRFGYDNIDYHEMLEDIQPNWYSRIANLLILKDQDNKYYQKMIDRIMEYIEELHVDLDNIYVYKDSRSKEEKITPELSEEENKEEVTQIMEEEKAEEEVKEEPTAPIVEGVQFPTFEANDSNEDLNEEEQQAIDDIVGNLDNINAEIDRQEEELDKTQILDVVPEQPVTVEADLPIVNEEGMADEVQPIVQDVVPEPEVQSNRSVDPHDFVIPDFLTRPEDQKKEETIVQPVEPTINLQPASELDKVDTAEPGNARGTLNPDTIVIPEGIKNYIDDAKAKKEQMEAEAKAAVEGTEVVTPVEETEEVSMNTGSYEPVDINVTGLNNEEVQSVIAEPKPGEALGPEEAIDGLGKYKDVLEGHDPMKTVINSNGEGVALLDYLIFEGTAEKVPLDATVVCDDVEMSGKEFIEKYVIPMAENNTIDKAYSVDDIINMHITSIQKQEEPKKKGLFGLFGKAFKK